MPKDKTTPTKTPVEDRTQRRRITVSLCPAAIALLDRARFEHRFLSQSAVVNHALLAQFKDMLKKGELKDPRVAEILATK